MPNETSSDQAAEKTGWDGVDRRGGERQERRSGDRRDGCLDRRLGLDRRRGPGRRRSDSRRSAEEGEMNPDQFEFILAIDEYKRANNRPFPSWTEVLDIVRALGYRKVAEPGTVE